VGQVSSSPSSCVRQAPGAVRSASVSYTNGACVTTGGDLLVFGGGHWAHGIRCVLEKMPMIVKPAPPGSPFPLVQRKHFFLLPVIGL
jgi:hypothetical protein